MVLRRIVLFGPGRGLALLAAYGAGAVLLVATAALATDRLLHQVARELPKAAQVLEADRRKPAEAPVQMVLAERKGDTPIQVAQYWSNRPAAPVKRPVQSLGIFGLLFQAEPPPPPETYATVCVRQCDGYYWPVSFATSSESFGRDERVCQSSCASPTRLYIYRNPGGSTETMQDLRGQPYSRTSTAFLYRTSYNESCKCKAHPWEKEAQDRHRLYALQQSAKKGDKKAIADLQVAKDQAAAATKAKVATAASTSTATALPPGAAPATPRPKPQPGIMALGNKPSAGNKASGNSDWRKQFLSGAGSG
ncbi:MAG: DUF2865 domain-containing protein [Hyphomicrobiaceae bacterium]